LNERTLGFPGQKNLFWKDFKLGLSQTQAVELA